MADEQNDYDPSKDEWIVVKDPKNGKKVALVCLHGDDGVIGFKPFYDYMDFDQDGKVSMKDWLLAHVPIVGAQAVATARGALMLAIALDDRVMDDTLFIRGEQVIIHAAFVALHEAMETLWLDKLGEAAGEVAEISLEMHGAAMFMIKKGTEKLFNSMVHHVVDN